MKTKVLLADDNKTIRQTVKTLLNSQDNIEVIGEAEYGAFGYLLKKSIALDLVSAINEVGKGNMFLSSAITNILVRRV
jgi:DNA-binding NarL/FixJ family response regulator